jgi:sRNA-binding carbon storage regulator CsrA
MLVLTRKERETILVGPIPAEAIGTTIVLTCVATSAHRVRIGVEADRSIPVTRGELPREPQDALPVESDRKRV